jgi:tRNA(Ile)-lysidine synthase
MEQQFFSFLKQRALDSSQPLLLAYSGGPDSLALLHLLLEYQKKHPLAFALAHVDHGWRAESRAEAEQIAAYAQLLGVPLHLKVLDKALLPSTNLEAVCREARYQFFRELYAAHGYRAVLLAHHADDLAETVFKRMMEGASLPYLSGMAPESKLYGMKLWRPLLSVKKAVIVNWLQKRGMTGFVDRTNSDPVFLRGRLRTEIFPALAKQFGKEILGNLAFLGKEAGELRVYLDQKIEKHLCRVVHSEKGIFLDLSVHCPDSAFETRYLIQAFCRLAGFGLSREQLDLSVSLLLSGIGNKRLEKESKILYIDRKRVFISDRRHTLLA